MWKGRASELRECSAAVVPMECQRVEVLDVGVRREGVGEADLWM